MTYDYELGEDFWECPECGGNTAQHNRADTDIGIIEDTNELCQKVAELVAAIMVKHGLTITPDTHIASKQAITEYTDLGTAYYAAKKNPAVECEPGEKAHRREISSPGLSGRI